MPTVSPARGDFHTSYADYELSLAHDAVNDDLRNAIDAGLTRLAAAVPSFDGTVRRHAGYRVHPTHGRTWESFVSVTVFLDHGHVTGTGDTVDAAVDDVLSNLATTPAVAA